MTEIFGNVGVMCFSETYLNPEHNIDSFLVKNNYKQFRYDVPSTHNHAGMHGVMICAKKNLNPLEMSLATAPGLESMTIVIDLDEIQSKMIICAIYRPPSEKKEIFISNIKYILDHLPGNVATVVCGDFNDNIKGKESSSSCTRPNPNKKRTVMQQTIHTRQSKSPAPRPQ